MMFIFSAFCVVFVALLPNLVWLLWRIVSLFTGHRPDYAPFGWTAFGLVLAVILFLSYGFFIGRWRLKVKEIEYADKGVPEAFDGFRIVHISDLHLNTFSDRPDQLERFVSIINGQRPDLICFTGDLVTMGREEAEPFTETLRKLSAGYGVFSVLGNHDFMLYDRRLHTDAERVAAVDGLAAYETDTLGWNLLRDCGVSIEKDGGTITIIGVDNRNCSNQGFITVDRGNLKKATEGTRGFRILLSHDPSHWDAEILPETDIPLTLSGHTHAAQTSILGWTPASLIFNRTYGRYDEDGQTLYVNPGLGCTAPFRVGANPEVTVFTLRTASGDSSFIPQASLLTIAP